MKFKTLFLLFILLGALMLNFACKKDKKKTEQKIETTIKEKEPELKVFPIPTPFEITEVINKAGVEYNPNLLNSVDKQKSYLTTKAQAINLGIYGADLSYVNVFNQPIKVKEYFAAIKYLTDELGLSLLFNDDFLQRIDNNINNADSLYKIATESYYKTYSYLVDRGKSDIASIVLVGSFIEGLYLAFKSTEKAKNPDILYSKIAEQKFASQQIISLLEKNSQLSELAEEILEETRPIDAILRKIKFKDDKPVYTMDDMELLKTAVYKTRNSFVNMQ